MGGGLLNIISYGTNNILIYGNPQKSIFKCAYKSITNFGQQKFVIEQHRNMVLSESEETHYTFKIPRHGDLLGECYLCVELPDIWSPIFKITDIVKEEDKLRCGCNDLSLREVGFKWIEELGSNMINEVTIESGGHTLARYTGEYFSSLAHRDRKQQIKLWNEMTGNIPELYDPANVFDRMDKYPNAYFEENTNKGTYFDDVIEPSIHGRKLYIPLDMWFTKSPAAALPLVALQYAEITINIKLRPIQELYMVKDITDLSFCFPYVKPNNTSPYHQFSNFLSPPKSLNIADFNTKYTWNPNIHLIGHYYFLDKKERVKFAKQEHKFLINDIYTEKFFDLVGHRNIKLETRGLISSYMFRFRRNDAVERNEWSNYTNWAYKHMPFNITEINNNMCDLFQTSRLQEELSHINKRESNRSNILKSMEIVLDGVERESTLDYGIYRFIEPYSRSEYSGKDYMYYYNYTNKCNSYQLQPYGGMNLDKFKDVELRIETILPPAILNKSIDNNVVNTRNPRYCVQLDSTSVADTKKQNLINMNPNTLKISSKRNEELIRKTKSIYEYGFDLEIFTERYNVMMVKSGIIGLLFAR